LIREFERTLLNNSAKAGISDISFPCLKAGAIEKNKEQLFKDKINESI
jgi:hypothetical protein